MSQKTVQLMIGRLLTDEDLRLQFVERPRETLADLRDQGFELTNDEIDALARSDPKMWPSVARRIHPRLQRCSLRARKEKVV
ncbi:MAG: Os1348 family NHLP clan protein [Acidobacteriia bacterium]|nr:Os1348 family NHLP clan protein [Terriglobia bacterium]